MYWVCVGIQPQTSLTLDYPTTSPTIPDEVPWTSTPLPSVDYNFTPSPTQGPLPTNCANYYFSQPVSDLTLFSLKNQARMLSLVVSVS
jgi:hypothetical protein